MTRVKAHFLGLLTNVDASIKNVKLKYGFKIGSFPLDKAINFFSLLEGSTHSDMNEKLILTYLMHSREKRIYFITKTLKEEMRFREPGISFPQSQEFDDCEKNLVHGYLNDTLKLMRLYKEGNICMPEYRFYIMTEDKPFVFVRTLIIPPFTHERYSLNTQELAGLNEFLTTTKLPFQNPALELAHENYEITFRVETKHLSFLSLMMALETLFHPTDEGELQYRISRNVATLLGGKEKPSSVIHKEVRELYRKRSKLVHTGTSNITDGDLLALRSIVRESIKALYKLGVNKEDWLQQLNYRGFTELPEEL